MSLHWDWLRRSAGTHRGDRAELFIGPWQIELGTGFDYIYDFEGYTRTPHAAFLDGEGQDAVREHFGDDGLAWALDAVRTAPEHFAATVAADAEAARRWESLPVEDLSEGWVALEKLDYRTAVTAGGATFEPWSPETKRPRLTLADGSDLALPVRTGEAQFAVAVGPSLFIISGRLCATHQGAIPDWLDPLYAEWGLSLHLRVSRLYRTSDPADDRVVGGIACDMPPTSRLGRLFGRGSRVRLDPVRGPVAIRE